MLHHHRLLTAALVLALAGCKSAEPIVRTETVVLPQRVYVGIPGELTRPCPIAEGTRAEVFAVARQRKAALEECNGKLQAIRELSEKAAKQSEGER